MINWRTYIESDSSLLSGKPVLKGTRISVEFILERLADEWTEEDILENYPHLSTEMLKAVYSYVYDCMRDGLLFIQSDKLQSANCA